MSIIDDLDAEEVGSWTSRPSTAVSSDERFQLFRNDLGRDVQAEEAREDFVRENVQIDPEWAGFRIQEPQSEDLKRLAALKSDEVDAHGLQMFFAIPDSVEDEKPLSIEAPPYNMVTNLKTGVRCESFSRAKRYLPSRELVYASIGKFRILEATQTPITLLDWHGPWTFHVRFEALNRLFYVIESSMQMFYAAAALNPAKTLCKTLPVAVQHEQKWRRGKVIRRNRDGKIEVKLIDLGCVVNFEQDRLYPLPEMFALVPRLAFTCYIHQVTHRDNTLWSRARSETRILQYRRELNATVEAYQTGKLGLTLGHPKIGRDDSSVLKKCSAQMYPRGQILYREFLNKVEKQVEFMRNNGGKIQENDVTNDKLIQSETVPCENIPPVETSVALNGTI
ncbi:TUDOR domain containing protein [Trichuris trichiura]|uniref:TUDOR domain containing protein n=1 Tax=Trichuris trichiura TaxID=36087 RepID=A0A077ZGI7_TRITR|nr:TUDOR domain containing protein [Trichuris trichiura]